MLCAPTQKRGLSNDCKQWMSQLISNGHRIVVPEIADYEIRRELIRAKLTNSITRLDALNDLLEYVPLSTAAMRKAAELWATARQAGTPTAGDNTIDADMILAAQMLLLDEPNSVIATTNVGHLSRFVNAKEWHSVGIRSQIE